VLHTEIGRKTFIVPEDEKMPACSHTRKQGMWMGGTTITPLAIWQAVTEET